jgi:hypothetical protein
MVEYGVHGRNTYNQGKPDPMITFEGLDSCELSLF